MQCSKQAKDAPKLAKCLARLFDARDRPKNDPIIEESVNRENQGLFGRIVAWLTDIFVGDINKDKVRNF